MKRNVRKKILLLTVCAMIVGALLLTGCRPPNNIDDPWLDTWQAVVVDRSVEVEKVETNLIRAGSSSQLSLTQTTTDADEIARLLNSLRVENNSFDGTDKSEDEFLNLLLYMTSSETSTKVYVHFYRDVYQLKFYLQGTDDPFEVYLDPVQMIVFHAKDENEFICSKPLVDAEKFESIIQELMKDSSFATDF